MGSIPQLSVMRGESHPLPSGDDREVLLHRLLERTAEESAAAPAVIYGDRTLSYSALIAAAARLARVLVRHVRAGVKHANCDGDHLMAVCMEPSERLVVILLAVWQSGAAYLPLDPSFPAARVRQIIDEAQPSIVIVDKADPEKFGSQDHLVSFEDIQSEARDLSGDVLDNSEVLVQGQGQQPLALVLYTSGSTGTPKGVRLPHRVILNRLQWQWRVFPYGDQERMCVFKTALTFVDSVAEIWGPLLRGRAVLVVPKEVTRDPERLVQLLDKHQQVERLVLVPSLLRALLLHLGPSSQSRPAGNLRQLRLWVCSGEPLALDLVKQFFHQFPPGRHVLCNFYGSTEVMGDVTYHVMRGPQDVVNDRVPIGCPLDNTVLYLLDAQYRPVVNGEVGEVFVSGLNLAAGYVNRRDPDRFVPNPLTIDPDYSTLYRTGDYARLCKGTLLYEGRTDSQVKVRGHRVDLSEVERAVSSVQAVDKVVVLCYKPGEMEQALLAFVTLNPEKSLTALQIESELHKMLASYMLPQVVLRDSIPLLVNGKTDRQRLLKEYEDTPYLDRENVKVELDYTDVPQKQMDAATRLFETVASVLGSAARTKLSLQSNFYELGGNSLNSVYTVTKLREQGYIIGITDFISAKNLSQVLDCIYPAGENNTLLLSNSQNAGKYVSQMLNDSHKSDVTSIIANSFYEKADLEQWLLPHIKRDDYAELLDKMWEPLVEKNFSFVVRTKQGDIVGVALNFDAHDEPNVEITSKLTIIFDFLEYLEGPIRDNQLPQGKGKVLHSFMMGTHQSLSYQQNIEVIQFMEEEVLKMTQAKGFVGIFTTNTSPLTQQLGTVYKYNVLLDFPVNTYIAPDGTKPFAAAPDWQMATCSWRTV